VLVLFDHGTPKGLIRALPGHTVYTAQAKGWDTLSNGALLNAAEEAKFDVLLTTDRRIRYQQNLQTRRIALVVFTGSTKWYRVREQADRIAAADCCRNAWQLLGDRDSLRVGIRSRIEEQAQRGERRSLEGQRAVT
jgi:hypothetical protein